VKLVVKVRKRRFTTEAAEFAERKKRRAKGERLKAEQEVRSSRAER
jgi:hypothetical protein